MSKLSLTLATLVPLLILPGLMVALLTSKIVISIKKWIAYISPEMAGISTIFLITVFNHS